ncbi:hypothetical protein [Pigmentiphaga litoralis]|uniref:hypothetical protein n=1 Tax=Pigmentiphaga litoralis TaxID=516702 RepID=UPI001674DEC7|nr:hypothetical protein [Pigmentiphaga litoralis]
MAIIVIAALVCITTTLGLAVPLCRAAKVGDGQLAACARLEGHQEIAAVYSNGAQA